MSSESEIPKAELLHDFSQHKSQVRQVAFRPDSEGGARYLASAGYDHAVAWYDFKEKKSYQAHECGDDLYSLKWSPDGKIIAVGDQSGEITLISGDPEGKGKKHVATLDNNCMKDSSFHHVSQVYSLAWSADSSLLVSGTSCRKVNLWRVPPSDPSGASHVRNFPQSTGGSSLPDSQSADVQAMTFDVGGEDGNNVFYAVTNTGQLVHFDIRLSGTGVAHCWNGLAQDMLRSIACSQKYIACGSHEAEIQLFVKSTLLEMPRGTYPSAKPEMILRLKKHSWCMGLSFIKEDFLLSSDTAACVKIWNLKTKKEITNNQVGEESSVWVFGVAVSHNRRFFAACSSDSHVRIFKMPSAANSWSQRRLVFLVRDRSQQKTKVALVLNEIYNVLVLVSLYAG